MTSISKSFPAKILLFGEYTIINGGSALAIPFWKYSGKWFDGAGGINLNAFYEHLLKIDGADRGKIAKAQAVGRTYDSSIPSGYGLGSSGSLSAAAYVTFFEVADAPLEAVRKKLSAIESFFHGKSSGMDPLTCYYQQPVQIEDGQIHLLDKLTLPAKLKLLDSKKTRFSKPLIEHFKIRMDADGAYEAKVTALSKFNSRIIDELISGRDLSSTFKEISSLQYELFIRMIPTKLRTIWQTGLETDKYYMKLSGAGGGGYFLVWENEDSGLVLEELV